MAHGNLAVPQNLGAPYTDSVFSFRGFSRRWTLCAWNCHITMFMHDLVSRANHVCLRPNHMRKLYELSQAPNKIFKPLPGGDHNSSVLEEGYFESISDFIASITQEYPTTPPEKSRM